ncbi:hypothetical protein T492DRAFT_892807, partial [Pavlovales sp. CCMP2436]
PASEPAVQPAATKPAAESVAKPAAQPSAAAVAAVVEPEPSATEPTAEPTARSPGCGASSAAEPATEPTAAEPTFPSVTEPTVQPAAVEPATVTTALVAAEPTTHSATEPTAQPATAKPAAQSAAEPAAEPAAAEPASQPTTKPAIAKPTAQPAAAEPAAEPAQSTAEPAAAEPATQSAVESATAKSAAESTDSPLPYDLSGDLYDISKMSGMVTIKITLAQALALFDKATPFDKANHAEGIALLCQVPISWAYVTLIRAESVSVYVETVVGIPTSKRGAMARTVAERFEALVVNQHANVEEVFDIVMVGDVVVEYVIFDEQSSPDSPGSEIERLTERSSSDPTLNPQDRKDDDKPPTGSTGSNPAVVPVVANVLKRPIRNSRLSSDGRPTTTMRLARESARLPVSAGEPVHVDEIRVAICPD